MSDVSSDITVSGPPRDADIDAILHGGRNETTLTDVLDRVIDRGVVIQGDVVLQVAGVDLIHVGLRLVLRGVGHEGLPRSAADRPGPVVRHPEVPR